MLEYTVSKDTLRWAACRIIVLILYLLLRSHRVSPTAEICLLSLDKLGILRDCIAKQVLKHTHQLVKLVSCHYGTLLKLFLGQFRRKSRPWSHWWKANSLLESINSNSPTTSSYLVTGAHTRSFHPDFPASPRLPAPDLVFDTLLARGVAVRDNPNQISSIFLHFAVLISMDRSESQHLSGSENRGRRRLRLTPLYGSTPVEESTVRMLSSGLLKEDMFVSSEALRLPLGVRILLVMFNRFHNYIAGGLSAINECNRFPKSLTVAERDEALYQMARRITCRLYINIILNDYLRTFLGINRTDKKWTMGPESLSRLCISQNNHTARSVPCDTHEATMELIFESWWKSAISEKDNSYMSRQQSSTFKAGSSDSEIAQELCRSAQAVASAFSPNRVPVSLRDSEIRIIARSRELELPSLNGFRQILGLPIYRKIEDINSCPLVAAKLRSLYSHPDEIELYAGIVAEQPPPKNLFATAIVGRRLWTGSTVAHAIVRYTVALIRDDPFYTDGWSPSSVTSWGFREPASDKIVNYGCVMHKLILRAFPKHFAADSAYAHFPFVIPEGNRVILTRLGSDASYSFEASPGRLTNPTTTLELTSSRGSPSDLTGTLETSKHLLQQALENVKCTLNRGKDSTCHGPVEADLMEEVIAPYLADVFCSHFSLKASSTKANNGFLTTEVWQAVRSIHEPACNLDPVASLKLEKKARDAVEKLRVHITKSKRARMGRSLRETLLAGWQDWLDVDHSHCPAIRAVAQELATLQQILVECIEYFLTDGKRHVKSIQQLSADMHSDDPGRYTKAAARLFLYLLEGYRLYLSTDGRSFLRKTPGSDRTFTNVSVAARNNGIYPNALTLSPDRGLASYRSIGLGPSHLQLLSTQSVLTLFLELATASHWIVLDSCRGLPRRVTMQGRHLGTTDADDSVDIKEGDWNRMEYDGGTVDDSGGIVDDSWVVVLEKGCMNGDCNIENRWKPRCQGGVTLYVNKKGTQLSNMPGGLPVAWRIDS